MVTNFFDFLQPEKLWISAHLCQMSFPFLLNSDFRGAEGDVKLSHSRLNPAQIIDLILPRIWFKYIFPKYSPRCLIRNINSLWSILLQDDTPSGPILLHVTVAFTPFLPLLTAIFLLTEVCFCSHLNPHALWNLSKTDLVL